MVLGVWKMISVMALVAFVALALRVNRISTSDLSWTGKVIGNNDVKISFVNDSEGKMRDGLIDNSVKTELAEDSSGIGLGSEDVDVLFDLTNATILNKVEVSARNRLVSDHAAELSPSFVLEKMKISENHSNTYRYNNDVAKELHSSVQSSVQHDSALFAQQSDTKLSGKILRANKTLSKIPTMASMSMSEMDQMLLRNRAWYHSTKPRWSTFHDYEMVSAKSQIENAGVPENDDVLYAPAFRNISIFKRSYDLMEQMLKVYIYKDGRRPVFHQPLLQGIYASEGWFMKLMKESRNFVVTDPSKANMFYLPFSSRQLRTALYGLGRRKLAQRLKDYVNAIAAKYPFWNRTGGADHFVVACHDWAPYETRRSMEGSIRALCASNVKHGFSLGKDVALPTTHITSSAHPLSGIGGNSAENRPLLAFFAGNLHGKLRPILLQHWENKDPEMKISGPMPRDTESRMAYIRYMKTSKYCICPKGYEVHSPRIVEALFYECVPVVISDNYVLPFFEVLNWEAFSVTVAEADIGRLKEILMAIPDKKYLELQRGVRRVQQHFVWHSKPEKYDLFHMILHSVWYNRVFTAQTR